MQRPFAVLGVDRGGLAPGQLAEEGVVVEKWPAGLPGQVASDGRLAGSHHADEQDPAWLLNHARIISRRCKPRSATPSDHALRRSSTEREASNSSEARASTQRVTCSASRNDR